MNYPDGLQKDGNKPYILNQSEKGILKITKVDSTDRGVTLPDAEFALYGPYASENAVLETRMRAIWRRSWSPAPTALRSLSL